MFARLRQRPLDLYIAYRTLASTWAFMPLQVLYLEQRGLELSAIFDLNVVFSLATVAFEVPTGMYADRRGRRTAMALGGAVMSAACVLFVFSPGFWIYAVANVLFALSMTLASGADSAWLYDHLTETHQQLRYARLEGLSTAAKGVGNLVAVLLGGLLFAIAPWSVFIFTAAITGTAALIALALPEDHHPPRDGSWREDLLRAWNGLATSGRLVAILCFGAITFVMLRISLFADQPHLEVHLTELSISQLALAASLLQAGKEIGGAVIASGAGTIFARVKTRFLVPALAVVVVGIYVVMGYGIGVVDVVAMMVLSSLFGLFSPLMRALMNRAIPTSRDRATLLSFESMGRRLLFAAASPLFGRAVESSSLHATFSGTAWVAIIMYVALGFYTLGTPRIVPPQDSGGRTALNSYVG